MAHKADQKKTYPSDVTEEEWAFCAPYLTLMKEDVPQRKYALRTLFNGLRYMVRAGCPWRMLPHDLPPWQAIQQQTLRWIAAGVFEDMAADLRRILRLILERAEEPSAVILDGRTVQSTPESGARAGYDGHKRRKGSKVHIAVDTLGHLLALRVTSADQQERHQVEALAREVQQATAESDQQTTLVKSEAVLLAGHGEDLRGLGLGRTPPDCSPSERTRGPQSPIPEDLTSAPPPSVSVSRCWCRRRGRKHCRNCSSSSPTATLKCSSNSP